MSYLTEKISSAVHLPKSAEKALPIGEEEAEMRVLVAQAQHGDQRAFETLYERYNGQLCRYLSRMMGNDGMGSELTQETFLKAWSSLPSLRSPASFVSWLYRIATNCAHTYQKKHAKQQHEVPLQSYLEGEEALSVEGPEGQIEASELLRVALARVSQTYRPYLILYIIEDLPQRKIAELLGTKETCVSKYVSRGLEEMRRLYHEEQSGTTGTRRREK